MICWPCRGAIGMMLSLINSSPSYPGLFSSGCEVFGFFSNHNYMCQKQHLEDSPAWPFLGSAPAGPERAPWPCPVSGHWPACTSHLRGLWSNLGCAPERSHRGLPAALSESPQGSGPQHAVLRGCGGKASGTLAQCLEAQGVHCRF